jgi:hypothetical protein
MNPPVILHLDAGHDRNGNPRRCFAVFNPDTGELIETLDEGYRGSAVYRDKYPEAKYLGRVPTTAAYRRELLRG